MIALSTLMSTSMVNMEKVIQGLEAAGIRDQVKVIVGGGRFHPPSLKKIGADGYSANAVEAVKLVDRLLAG